MPLELYRVGSGALQGWGGTSEPPPPPPPPTPEATVFGYNYNGDTSYQTIAGRKAKFGGRNPCPRIYTGAAGHPLSFGWGIADEDRMSWSFKAGGGQSSSYLASNAAKNERYIPALESIPAYHELFWTYHHEPNSSGGMEVPVNDFVNTFTRMKEAKAAASLNPGVKVHIVSNFMAYQVDTNNWSDDWVPRDAEILTWDMYGNPGQQTSASGSNKYGGPATGDQYDTTYPLIEARTAALFRVTERTGFAKSWGILEVNTPLRNWDTGEVGRKAWHQDWLDYSDDPPMAGGVAPKIHLLWEAPSGVNWVQGFGYNNSTSLDPAWAGGTNNYSSTKASASPLWDVWKPYITGTPLVAAP